MDQELLGFPLWLRINHFINLFCIFVLMRSGVQILADHPKLYWNDAAMPGSEWVKFGKKVMPKDRLWTSMDEAEHINSLVALRRRSTACSTIISRNRPFFASTITSEKNRSKT